MEKRIKKNILTIIFILFISLNSSSMPVFGAGQDKSDAALNVLEQKAVTFYYNGDLEGAVSALKELNSQSGPTSNNLMLMGHIFRQLGNPAEANAAYIEAQKISRAAVESVKEAPDVAAKSKFFSAYCFYLNGEYKTAARELSDEKKSGTLPSYMNNEACYLLGMIEFNDKKYKKACEILTELNEGKPGIARYLNLLGMCYESLGELNKAHECYIEAFKADYSSIELLFKVAPFMLKIGDIKTAYKYYGILISKFKNNSEFNDSYKKLKASMAKSAEHSKPSDVKEPEPKKVKTYDFNSPKQPEILVGLNTKSDGAPVELKSIKFMSSGDFVILNAGNSKQLFDGKSLKCYEISYETSGYIVKNISSGNSFKLGKSEILLKPISNRDTVMFRGVKVGAGSYWEGSEARYYRGAFLFKKINGKNNFNIVNRIKIEEYLLSVLNSEMPASYPDEALAAQAICARSEVLHKKSYIKKHKKYGYDVCDDQDCQMYRGVSWETPKTTKAVIKTAGMVLMQNGKICDAIYSDNCGGYTQASRDIKGWGDVAYLTAHSDIIDRGELSRTNFNPVLMEEIINNEMKVYCRPQGPVKNYESRWVRTISADLINDSFKEFEIGKVVKIIPRRRALSGHLDSVEIVGTRGRKIVEKELEIRRMIKYSPLRSSKFVVDTVYNKKSGQPESFIFSGAGFGHGVGLCQNGSYSLANSGSNYNAILKHYFSSARLEKTY